jgi:hypothetical protein
MILIDNAVISDDIKEQLFVCDLDKCKGACCVEGDLGAPLEDHELKELEDAFEAVKPYLSEGGLKAIDKEGPLIILPRQSKVKNALFQFMTRRGF